MSLIALVAGELAYALDSYVTQAVCRDPLCGAAMYRRAAEGVAPHWSHNPGTAERCEADREMSLWHAEWQQRCDDKSRVEVTIGRRRADVLSRFGWAIEFQHSNLRGDKVRGREDDWRGKLLWVQDAIGMVAREDLIVEDDGTFVWHNAPSRVVSSRCHQLVDLGLGPDRHRLLWLPGRRMARSGGELRGRGVLVDAQDFVSKWINGKTAFFPHGWARSRYAYEQEHAPNPLPPQKPRSRRLQEAMDDARIERELGVDAGTCGRSTTARPCIDCSGTPRPHSLAPIPPGYRLCESHWPRLSWEAV